MLIDQTMRPVAAWSRPLALNEGAVGEWLVYAFFLTGRRSHQA